MRQHLDEEKSYDWLIKTKNVEREGDGTWKSQKSHACRNPDLSTLLQIMQGGMIHCSGKSTQTHGRGGRDEANR
jgi:hypothetical protein